MTKPRSPGLPVYTLLAGAALFLVGLLTLLANLETGTASATVGVLALGALFLGMAFFPLSYYLTSWVARHNVDLSIANIVGPGERVLLRAVARRRSPTAGPSGFLVLTPRRLLYFVPLRRGNTYAVDEGSSWNLSDLRDPGTPSGVGQLVIAGVRFSVVDPKAFVSALRQHATVAPTGRGLSEATSTSPPSSRTWEGTADEGLPRGKRGFEITAKAREVGESLPDLLRTHGGEVLTDPRAVRALLSDTCPGASREIALIAMAVELGIPRELEAQLAPARSGRSQVLARMAQRMGDERGVLPEAGRWAVDTWQLALSRATPSRDDRPSMPTELNGPS